MVAVKRPARVEDRCLADQRPGANRRAQLAKAAGIPNAAGVGLVRLDLGAARAEAEIEEELAKQFTALRDVAR
eukprot:1487371-Lingulodinium_polyedra.AAC.1